MGRDFVFSSFFDDFANHPPLLLKFPLNTGEEEGWVLPELPPQHSTRSTLVGIWTLATILNDSQQAWWSLGVGHGLSVGVGVGVSVDSSKPQ